MVKFKLILILILTTILPPMALAIEGIIMRSGNQQLIYLSDGSSYPVSGNSHSSRTALNRLNNGDYIYGDGRLEYSSGTIVMETVDVVGLNNLLGAWVGSQDTNIFDFVSFKNLQIYTRKQNQNFSSIPQNWHYWVTPGDLGSWSIFISKRDQVLYGSLGFTNNHLRISIYNPGGEYLYNDRVIPISAPRD